MTNHWPRRIGVVFAAVVVLATAACGDDDARPAQPAPRNTRFERGLFDEIPRYPRSDPLAPASEQKGVVVQSFGVQGTEPDTVLDWYADQLSGWANVRRPEPFGRQAWRGVWEREDQRLLVSAGPAPTFEQDPADIEQTTTQYSLTLGKPGVRVLNR
jgi:hypothetical protein